MSERTDATLLPLGGSATMTRVVIVAGVSEIQSLLDAVEDATDALEKDDDEVVFHNQEDVPLGPGISEQVRRAQCTAKALFAPGPNDVGITDAVTSSDPSPLQLETKVPLAANNGRVDPLVDPPAYLSRNDTPLNLVHSEPQTEPLEVPKPIAHNQGETQSESSAGSPELEVDRDKASALGGEEVPLMEQTAQEVTQLAGPVPEKERGQVNREEEAPAEGPNEELLSESHDEVEEDEEEDEDAVDSVQQEITWEGSQGSGGTSQMSSTQFTGDASSRKSSISCHSYSKYNTVSYRKIRKGNTKQRIDEFESMMNL